MKTTILLIGAALACSPAALAQLMPRIMTFDESPAAVERLRNDVADVMALEEAAMLALVPEQSGIYFTDCPNCEHGAQDRANFIWKPQDPHHITCKDCGERYPDNEKYPDQHVLEVRSINGTHQYPYYQRPDGYQLFFRAHADYWARDYMAKRAMDLAKLWWITKDEPYARRAAAILVRFAEVYPGYALHYDYPFQPKKVVPYDHGPIAEALRHGDGNMRTAKWTWWAYMDISVELAAAYDVLRQWPSLAALAGGRAIGMIDRDLLGAMIDNVMVLEETYSNMSPHKWRAAMQTARVLERPEVVHDAVGRMEKFLDGRFLYDGSWMETSPSYMEQVAGMMSVFESALAGYADPPDYAHPQTGRRLAAEDVADLLALRGRILEHLDRTRFPDGRLIPVNDTWSFSKRPARDVMTPALSPGFGVAVLGAGEADKQFHAYLNFTSGESHNQYSSLSIGLWAHGKEMLSDIGYTHTKYRYWPTSTASHNTVTVDGADQQFDARHMDNRLRLWASDGRGFSVVEAEAVGAYPQTSRYRRTLLAVGENADNAYLVDIFQVHGGGQHDYILAGNADEDSTAALANLSLEPFADTLLPEGVTLTLPRGESDFRRGEALGFISNLRSAPALATVETVVLDFRLLGEPQTGSRSWLLAEPNTTVFLGDAPSIRRSQRQDHRLEEFRMPMFVARRRGSDVQSTFVAVHEPIRGEPGIAAVSARRQDNLIVVTVTRGDATDYALVALDGPATADFEAAHGAMHFAGRQALVRVRGGAPPQAIAVGVSRLAVGGVELSAGPDGYRGQVTAVHRGKFADSGGYLVLDHPIPADMNLNTALIVRHADDSAQGFNVVRVESNGGGAKVFVREDPGFEYHDDGVQTVCYPQRTIVGGRSSFEWLTLRQERQ